MKTELPVRSAVLKHGTGGLVIRWVTTGEYPAVVCSLFLGKFRGKVFFGPQADMRMEAAKNARHFKQARLPAVSKMTTSSAYTQSSTVPTSRRTSFPDLGCFVAPFR